MKKEDKTVGHLLLGKSGKFAKTIIYFLRADKLSSCKVVITGKLVNLGDGDVTQMPCKLFFSEVKKCINILQKQMKQETLRVVTIAVVCSTLASL